VSEFPAPRADDREGAYGALGCDRDGGEVSSEAAGARVAAIEEARTAGLAFLCLQVWLPVVEHQIVDKWDLPGHTSSMVGNSDRSGTTRPASIAILRPGAIRRRPLHRWRRRGDERQSDYSDTVP
jgi:hypothetical protein